MTREPRPMFTHGQALCGAALLVLIAIASYGGALALSLLGLGVGLGVFAWCCWKGSQDD